MDSGNVPRWALAESINALEKYGDKEVSGKKDTVAIQLRPSGLSLLVGLNKCLKPWQRIGIPFHALKGAVTEPSAMPTIDATFPRHGEVVRI